MKFLRFTDLVALGIVRNRMTLGRWVRDHGFPPGVLLGPNSRAWSEAEVRSWLASRCQTRGAHDAV
jgi:predicted DNA-binding transcriptional regulator AlpA